MDSETLMEALAEENQQLRTRLALHFMDGTEEDKQAAEKLFYELQDEIRLLRIEVSSLTNSRDSFQSDNRRLKRRIAVLEGKK